MADEPTVETPQPQPPAMIGGPGEPAPQPPAAPAPPRLVPVKFLDREYLMTEEAAAAWRDREAALSRQGQELGHLRSQVRQPEPPPKPAEPALEQLWFENPTAAYAKIREDLHREFSTEYRREQALRDFWTDFYTTNDDLRPDKDLVQLVFQQHANDLLHVPIQQAHQKLADLTRERILSFTRRAKSADPTPRVRLTEPASGPVHPAAVAAVPQEPEVQGGLSAILKARAAARHKARTGIE